ncbi:UNVERIFIED_CONTAM: Retrovirus-related Pol polyprotein from transposon TNT 1-94 [Sesamum latifolium]|uniref:Retrovirus-related Pol polyprotein from transposon TNT 1-94 n=1 Tax=Sesamum latifolium TaxID=2727402 RepID=A0AAW2YB89_9LAMI
MVYLQESKFNVGAENNPETFSQAMISRESNLWYDAMKEEMYSMAFNEVWDLVELPDGFKAIGCKEEIDYTETFSPVSKKNSLRTIMALVSHFDMNLHQMDMKTTFMNGELEEEVYMKQPEGFSSSNENIMDQCIYQKMKDMGEASYVIGIKIHRDRSRCILELSQETYINKVLERFRMKDCSPSVAPIMKGDKLHLNQCPMNDLEREQMKDIPYASAIGSLMYAQVCTRPDIAFAMGMLGRYQSNPGLDHWRATKKVMSGAVSWRSAKQTLIATSTMEAELSKRTWDKLWPRLIPWPVSVQRMSDKPWPRLIRCAVSILRISDKPWARLNST